MQCNAGQEECRGRSEKPEGGGGGAGGVGGERVGKRTSGHTISGNGDMSRVGQAKGGPSQKGRPQTEGLASCSFDHAKKLPQGFHGIQLLQYPGPQSYHLQGHNVF